MKHLILTATLIGFYFVVYSQQITINNYGIININSNSPSYVIENTSFDRPVILYKGTNKLTNKKTFTLILMARDTSKRLLPKGAIVNFEDGTTWNKPDEIVWSKSISDDNKKWIYYVTLPLSDDELEKVYTKRISTYRVNNLDVKFDGVGARQFLYEARDFGY